MGTPKASTEELAAASKKATSAKSKARPADKHNRSPQKIDQESPNPAPPKRVKGKQPEDDTAKMIAELRKVPAVINKC